MIASDVRTRVELPHLEGKIERWIRFGRAAHEEVLDRRRRALWFAAGNVFAFVRWAANEKAMRLGRPLPSSRMLLGLTAVVAAVGIMAIVVVSLA